MLTFQNGAPYCQKFGDIYFSLDDGMSETNHVFIQGNDLTSRWKKCENFTIIETGFGTGLNFFVTWKTWLETANPSAKLNYISIEKYPLNLHETQQAIALWPELNLYVEEFANKNISLTNTHQTIHFNNISLTLIWQDVNDAIAKLETKADAWFLDGFAPAKNPQMWNDNLYRKMAALTKQGGTFATFTCAGSVRRGLQQHGFSVRKIAGFGKKRHILTGTFND